MNAPMNDLTAELVIALLAAETILAKSCPVTTNWNGERAIESTDSALRRVRAAIRSASAHSIPEAVQ